MSWENETRRILRAELARRDITYAKLAARLRGMGVKESERSIANKLSRGTFSFIFFLQCMKALGLQRVSFDIETPGSDPRLQAGTSVGEAPSGQP